jgi:hypothetical protein
MTTRITGKLNDQLIAKELDARTGEASVTLSLGRNSNTLNEVKVTIVDQPPGVLAPGFEGMGIVVDNREGDIVYEDGSRNSRGATVWVDDVIQGTKVVIRDGVQSLEMSSTARKEVCREGVFFNEILAAYSSPERR